MTGDFPRQIPLSGSTSVICRCSRRNCQSCQSLAELRQRCVCTLMMGTSRQGYMLDWYFCKLQVLAR